MRIGIDIRVLGTGRLSGVEEYTRQLLGRMLPLERGVSFTLLALGRRNIGRESWMELPNVRMVHVWRSNRAALLSMRFMGRPRLDELAGGSDVFFFPHFLYGALSSKSRRVITFHDLSYERFPEFFTMRRRFWHQHQMRPRRQARKADRLIAVSRATARDLTELYGIEADRISVIHSGVNAQLQRAGDPELIAFRRHRGLHDPFILSLSTREPRKNLAGLVRAFEYVASQPGGERVQLMIAGPEGWRMRELHSAVRRSLFASRIRLVGTVEPSERALWYSAASVFAYPSFFEGFGFPPLEAMACGTPVVASFISSLPEVVGDAGLLVDPYDATELGMALHQVLTRPDLSALLVGRGLERVGRFSWQRTAESTLETLIRTAK